MNRNIKMIGMDLDGTLLNTDKKLTDYTKNVLAKAIEQGCTVLVATGRPVTAVPKELLEFPGMRYAVTANGARIMDVEKGNTIYENLLSPETAKQVLEVLAEYDDVYEIFIDGKGYTKADCLQRIDHYFEAPSMQEYMLTTRIPVEDVTETMFQYNRPVDKVHGIFHSVKERNDAAKRLEHIPGIVVAGAFANNLEANAAGTNKGIALLKLGEMLGIKQEEIMACGDGMNDYEMLKTVGFGVAMKNADERVKEIADYVTDTNDEDGVAKAIERFVLE